MLTKHRDVVYAQTVSCLGKITHEYRAHARMEAVAEATPLIATNCTCATAMFLLCSNVATRLLIGVINNRQQTSPLTSLEAW